MQMLKTEGWVDLRPVTWPAIAPVCKQLYMDYHKQMNMNRLYRKEEPLPVPAQYQ